MSCSGRRLGHNQGMRYSEQSLPVGVVSGPVAAIETDVLVVAAFEGEAAGVGRRLRRRRRRASRLRRSRAANSRARPGRSSSRRVLARLAAGPCSCWLAPAAGAVSTPPSSAAPPPPPRWRRATGAGAGWRSCCPAVLPLADEAQAAAEGLTLAAHYSGIYKSDADAKPAAIESLIAIPEQAAGRGARTSAERAAGPRVHPRGVQQPGARAGERAGQRHHAAGVRGNRRPGGGGVGLKADVLDEERLAGLNMGLLLGVARGSAEPPRVVVLRYEPARPGDRAPSSAWSARASPSTRAASPSSRPTACTR